MGDRAVLRGCQYPESGLYFITPDNNGRVKVMCAFDDKTTDAKDVAVTIKPCKSGKECFGFDSNCQGEMGGSWTCTEDDCANDFGLTRKYTGWNRTIVEDRLKDEIPAHTDNALSDLTGTNWDTLMQGTGSDQWLCSDNREVSTTAINTASIDHTKVTRAEAGKYVMSYHAEDSAGNAECETKFRTVIVRDTLPPIISLHLKNKASTVPKQDNREGLAGLASQFRSGNLLYMGDKDLLPDGHSKRQIMGQTASYTRDGGTVANEEAYENHPTFSTSPTTVAPPVPLFNKTEVDENYMAEKATASSSTWFVLAAASAAAGLALV